MQENMVMYKAETLVSYYPIYILCQIKTLTSELQVANVQISIIPVFCIFKE